MNHKFHYDSVKQAQKWLALHQAYSPTRNDADCQAIYEKSFEAAAAQITAKSVHVIGLGCGGGQKDTRLLKLLKAHGKDVFYTPCDVSAAMVLTARQTALAVVPEKKLFPVRLRSGHSRRFAEIVSCCVTDVTPSPIHASSPSSA